MHRIDSATAQADKFGTGKDGFTEGSPGVTAATETTDDWFDAVQEEIVGVIESIATPVKGDNWQMLRVIMSRIVRSLLGIAADRTPGSSFATVLLDAATDGDGTIVAVGAWDGTATAQIQQSTDYGETWTARAAGSSFQNTLYAIDWDGTYFCAVGHNGEIQTSTDGQTWTQNATSVTYTFADVMYANSIWVGVGASGQIYTATDPTSAWTQRTPAASYTGNFGGVAYSSNLSLWCIVGSSGEIQTAPDPTGTWTHRTPDASYASNFNDVAYHATFGHFVAVGQGGEIQTSPDGVTWTEQSEPNWGTGLAINKVFFQGEGVAIACAGGPALASSASAESWLPMILPEGLAAFVSSFCTWYPVPLTNSDGSQTFLIVGGNVTDGYTILKMTGIY